MNDERIAPMLILGPVADAGDAETWWCQERGDANGCR